MNDLSKIIIQNVFKFGGSALVAHGLATQADLQAVAGGVLALVGVIANLAHFYSARKAAAAMVPAAPRLVGTVGKALDRLDRSSG